jgi:thiopeptide-type bacteriocin biosynthesis protein
MARHAEHPHLEQAILAVLTGADVAHTAPTADISSADLAIAAETYRAAGRAAIAASPDTWVHVNIQPTDWASAETTLAVHLAPALRDAEAQGTITFWWYVRKHPYWRLRLHPGPHSSPSALRADLSRLLDRIQAERAIATWSPGIYEPETAALGGPLGIDAAHALFHADSRAILIEALWTCHDRPSTLPIGRPELSVLMCSAMLRAAGQEWTEQGDVWARVAGMRPAMGEPNAGLPTAVAEKIGVLLAADTIAMTDPGQALEAAADRVHAFARAGRELAHTARLGGLTRGLRDVLAHVVVFHWNRAAIPTGEQTILASAARTHILGTPGEHLPAPALSNGDVTAPGSLRGRTPN